MPARTRLVVAYAALLFATLIVFGIALNATRNAAADSIAVGPSATADSIVLQIRDLQRVQPDSVTVTAYNSATGEPFAQASVRLRKLLNGINGHFLVFGNHDQLVYASPQLKTMLPDTVDQLAVIRVAVRLATSSEE